MTSNSYAQLLFLIFAISAAPAFSAGAPFYRGKTLTVLINFAAGGPTDVEGRLAARFLGNIFPGSRRLWCRTCREPAE